MPPYYGHGHGRKKSILIGKIVMRFDDRVSRRLLLWGAVFFIVVCVFPAKDRFIMNNGGSKTVITRPDNPLIYWGTEAGILLVAISLIGCGIYRGRNKTE
jgi:hypothetical protein